MTAHEIHALSGAYAVDALDPEERARFEEHLAACSTCQAEVASLQEAAGVVGGLAATTPPPALRDRVLADIAAVRPLPPEAGTHDTTDDSTDSTAGPVVDLDARRSRRRWARPLAAAAAVLALAGGGAAVWQQVDHSSSPDLAAVDKVILARDAQHVSVDLPGGASATVYTSRAEGRAALVTRRMSPAPDGRVYELWLQKDGRMVPAGIMHGAGNQAVLLDGDLAGATAVGITVEPSGGSTEPTTEPIALFDFEQAT